MTANILSRMDGLNKMIPVDWELGNKIIDTCTCECGAGLTMAWGGSWGINGYVLRCTRDPDHSRIARPAQLGPYDLPGFNLFNLKGRREQMEEELGKERANKLAKYEGVASLTQVQARDILKTIWPKAPDVEVLKAALICHQYGLNPLMKHIFLIPYKNKKEGTVDWVTQQGIKSNRLIAQRKHHYSYMDLTPRRMTEDEQRKINGEIDNSKIWALTLLKDMDTGAEAPGVGSWPKDEDPYGKEKGNTKLNMACIRSERAALDRQYPGEMPEGVSVIDEEYIDAEYTVLDEKEPGEKGVKGTPKSPKSPKTTGKKASEAEIKCGAKQEGTGGVTEQETGEADAPDFIETETSSKKSEASAADIVGDGFNIDLQWLKDALSDLKWNDNTCKTFLVSQYKVSPQGTLEDVIKRLTREQAEDFVKQINKKLEKQSSLF